MRAELAALGINSLAVMPIMVGGEASGVLALYASEAGVFDEAEMRLLVELAGDVGFAIDYIEKEERVRYLAYYDSLTGLANRALFLERLGERLATAARDGRKLALLLINIDRFKTINDTLGRPAGDVVLKEFARRLQAAAGDASLVARVSGDHFAVMLPDVKSEESLRRRLDKGDARVKAEPLAVAGQELRLATRSGVALFPRDATDAESLYRNAEAALKVAHTGETYLFYRQEMTKRIAGKLTLENRLRTALEKSQFVLHYQPKLELATRRIVGAEALIRWASPEGLVPPAQFIPLLEETGLIVPVGAWAIEQALADLRRWNGAGLPAPRIAVNVSAVQLRQPDFVARMKEALGADPGIDVEITESLLMEDLDANVKKLQAVRALGVGITLDDFGTGYSSLSYLARLPVQSVKVDRSFIASMAENPDAMTLVTTIVSLARSLRLKVIAEGVETPMQESLLRAVRCDEAQGFLYARPMPASELEARLPAAG
jgi:diguanylate cyclase (GGDEF)-like protein